MGSTSSTTMQSLGEDQTTHAGCRCENMVFVSVFVCLSRSEANTLFVRGGHTLNKYCVMVYGSILMLFSPRVGSGVQE